MSHAQQPPPAPVVQRVFDDPAENIDAFGDQSSPSDGDPLFFFAARVAADFDPDIRDPGPDDANFPNSAAVVPVGVIYFETSPITFQTSNQPQSDQFTTATLLRVGLWKDFELRLYTGGATWQETPGGSITGFSPLLFDMKRHLFDGDDERGLPAVGLQLMVQTNYGTQALGSSRFQPAYSLNFDHDLPSDIQFEWNIGNTYTFGQNGDRFLQTNFSWAFQHALSEKLDGFVHGYLNGPASLGFKDESMLGWGVIWYPKHRLAVDGSYSLGLTPESPRELFRLGVSFAF